MTWRVAKAIKTLQAEVNAAHPDRPKAADGTIGDARHQAEKSDHNPVAPHPGVVTAWDITTAPFTNALAENLRLMAKAGDGRIKYLIYRGRIASDRDRWAWRPYSGFSKHFDHIHLSVSDDPAQYDRTDPWLTKAATEGDEMTADDWKRLEKLLDDKIDAAVKKLHDENVLILHGNPKDGHVNSIDSIAKQVGVPQT